MPRKPLGDAPLSNAERSARRRQKQAASEWAQATAYVNASYALHRIIKDAATLEEAQAIASAVPLLEP